MPEPGARRPDIDVPRVPLALIVAAVLAALAMGVVVACGTVAGGSAWRHLGRVEGCEAYENRYTGRLRLDCPPPFGAGMPEALAIAQDRGFRVPGGHVVRTGYVDVFKVRLANRSRMAVGDFDRAYQKRLQCGADQPFPCPNGHWERGGVFVIHDGRHEWLASVALGLSHILVAWTEAASPASSERTPCAACGLASAEEPGHAFGCPEAGA